MSDTPAWFQESHPELGTQFGLSIKKQLHQEKTPFQDIAIYESTHFGKVMVIDGIIMLSSRDNFFYHEMIAHPILFTHPNPKNVIIIGGGDCGTLKETLKHPIASVTQIEIDEKVTQLAQKYFPELCEANGDARAKLIFQDGIVWMQEAPKASEDVIIVDSTDPIGPAEGLFNTAFYTQCYRVLRDDGLLVQQSESPLLHFSLLHDMKQAMKHAGFSYLLTIPFPQPVYPGGWHSVTLASKQPVFEAFRQDNALLNQLNTQYYQFALHKSALTPIPFLEKGPGL